MAKEGVFITTELDWAEKRLDEWKTYIDDHPLHSLTDRVEGKKMVSVETQGKFIQDTMKNYLALLEVVKRLREKEEAKKEARGSGEIPHRMRK